MKKLRIAALVAALLLTVTALAGCDKLKIDDVKADPIKYVTDGMALTLDGTPFANITEAAKKGSYQIALSGEDFYSDAKLYLDTEAAKGSVEFEMEAPSEYDIDEETGELTTVATEKVALDAYYADKKIVIKSDLLNDYAGTDAIGLDMSVTEEDFKASALYDALLSMAGITEDDLAETESAINVGDITKAFSDYVNAVAEIGKNSLEFGEIAEEVIDIDGKEVKTVAVPFTVKEDIYDSIFDEAINMVKAVSKAMGEEMSEDQLADTKAIMEKSLPEYKAGGKYYLSAKTGAVVKETADVEVMLKVEEDVATTFKTKSEMTYGADPTDAFLPAVNLEMDVDGEKLTVSGKSSVTDGKFVFDGEVKVDAEADEDDTNGTFKFELASDGKFDLTLKDDAEDMTVSGTFTSDETKTELTIDLSTAYGEDEAAEITDIKLVITAGEEVPALPEYKDILDMTEEDLAPIISMLAMTGGTDTYEMTVEDYYYELTYYFDQTVLDASLDDYASQGYATRDDMICDTYIAVAMDELKVYMDEASINGSVTAMVNGGYSYKEIADSLYQMLTAYWMTDIEY